MKNLFIYILLLFPIIVSAQGISTMFKVNYEQHSNGEKQEAELNIIYYNQIVFLSNPDDKIRHYIDFRNNENVSTIEYENDLFKNAIPFEELPEPTLSDKEEVILGYHCQYATYSYFSNLIEVWYTKETIVKGSPFSKFVPNRNALVLKIIINGNREIIATSIEEVNDSTPPLYLADIAKQVTDAKFEEITINSRYTRLQVFKDDTINFDPLITPPRGKHLLENKTYHFSKGSVIMKKIKLTPELKNSGYVFAKLSCKSNGDAYDRTGSVIIIPESEKITMMDAYLYGLDTLPVYTDNMGNNYQGIKNETNYFPPIEIIRFFTSFGADHFNEKRKINNYQWKNDVIYKQEITSVFPSDEQEIWIGVFIGNYDKGGHIVSLELDFYPSFEEEETNTTKFVQPLFLTVNTMEMSGQNYGKLFRNDTLRVNFEIPENAKDLNLYFTSTGHGGWGGGDEFNPKLNRIFVDGEEVFSIVPWRTDCATYRLSNPASGNFGNGLSSSDLSRSNWCPGTLTPPYIVPLNSLVPGEHVVEVIIDQGEDEGKSFNHWGVSGVITGNINSD